MDLVASRHVPIKVDGMSSVMAYQRCYPGRIQVWVKFRSEKVAVKNNMPLRFLFEEYPLEEFSLTKVKHDLLDVFSDKSNSSPSDSSSIREAFKQRREKSKPKESCDSFTTQKTSRQKKTSRSSSAPADLTSEEYSGFLIDHGIEERELEGKEFNQYQCRIEDDSRDGNVTQIWGEDIKRAIKDSGVKIGDHVYIEEIRVKGERKKSFNISNL